MEKAYLRIRKYPERFRALGNIQPNGLHQLHAIAGGDHAGTETVVEGKAVILKALLKMRVADALRKTFFKRSQSKIVGRDQTDGGVVNQCPQHSFRADAAIMRVSSLENLIEKKQCGLRGR